MIKYLQRPLCYLAEFRFCLRIGKSWRDKLSLLQETALFHLRHNRPGGEVEATVHLTTLAPRLRLRTYGGDIFILHEVLNAQVYQLRPEWLKTAPQVIVDLGANIGLTALMLADQFPEARVICVEPHPENVLLLRHNLQCLGSRATIIQAAVADQPGTMRLALATEHYNASLVRDSEEGVEVRTLTVDDLCQEADIDKIDILKMDIEGAEKLILAGQPAWLSKVDVLLAELHGSHQDEMVRDIENAGLHVQLKGSQVSAWRIPLPLNRESALSI